MPPEGVGRFVLRTFLWLPVCFAAWYAVAPYHGVLAGHLARALVDAIDPNLVTGLEFSGPTVVFVTRLLVHPAPGVTGFATPEASALVYTYGLALFAALMLASRAGVWRLLAGCIALLPFQAWGIAFDFLSQVGVRMGPGISIQAGLYGWQREAIALGYQVGSLIFPALAPVLLWAAWNRRFITTGVAPADTTR
jgi:hypothetical protein